MLMRMVSLAVLALTTALAVAQSPRVSIRGMITDPGGAPVEGAVLLTVSESTGESRKVSSEAGGRFAVPLLLPGSYRIEVAHPGHAKFTTRVELQVNQDLWIPVSLSLGQVTEEIFVTASPFPLHTESAGLGTVIQGSQLSGLPLDGRNFLELSLLVPGAAPAPEGSASSLRGDFAFTLNGAREDTQSFLLDGFYNIDPKLNTPAVRPPVDGIREFAILTSTYEASFGRNAAGQVNVVSNSGGNQFHGTMYGFLRTRSLDARNFFAPADEPSPEYRRGQYGASIGGPIIQNRAFFFADYEHTRRREGITQIANVPTVAERSGDFSRSLLPAPRNPLTGLSFPDNRIPAEIIHPVGRAIAALYPLPNRQAPNANFVSSPTLREDAHLFDIRVDHAFSEEGALLGRYSFNDLEFFEPFVSTVRVPGFGTENPRRGQNLGLGWTHVLGASRINEFRFGYTRVAIGVFQEGALQKGSGRSLNQQVGLPELSRDPRDFGLSQISVEGFSPLGDEFTTPQESATDSLQLAETLAWAAGNHLVKFGGDFRWIRQEAYRHVQSRGFLNFSSRYFTGNALADLLLGFPLLGGGAISDNPQRLWSSAWSTFVQDSWRLRPGLTLNAGLRYEYIGPATDAGDRVNLYDPLTQSLMPAGAAGVPRGGYLPDRNDWAPRIGFAWTPDPGGATVLRGGYGLYYNQGALATGEGIYFNQPYFNFRLYALHLDPRTGVRPLTLSDPFPASYPPLPVSATGYQRDLKTGWLEHWSVSVQQQLGGRGAFEAAYVASRGHNLIAARDLNQPAPSTAFPNLRPNPLFDDITFIESRGRSDYHALQLKYQQRLDRGVSLLAAYTLSESNDDASGFFSSAGDPNFPQDSRNPEAEYARSSFDLRHRFSLSFDWKLPFGSILANSELQGIITFQSGPPFTVALLPELDNSNTGRSTLGFGANDRPNIVGTATLDDPTPERWFNPAAFAIPPFGSFGNAPRNLLDGPGRQNVNLAFLKHISVGAGEMRVQLRAEAFNLLNRANFNLPDAFVGSPTFGQVLSADSPRRCQLGVRLIF